MVFVLLMVLVACLATGCSEETTGPESKPPPSTEWEHNWSDRFGDADAQIGRGVAVDASGNVIITGHFYSTTDFGGGALTSVGNEDIFVAKFAPDGTHLWSNRFGDGSSEYGRSTAADASGNIIVVGVLYGSVDFGGGTLTDTGSGDIFVAKFGSDGTHLWSKRYGDSDDQDVHGVAADATGNVIIAGDFQGTVDFGGGAFTTEHSSRDGYVARYGPNGSHLWSESFGHSEYHEQYATGVTADASGNVTATGFFSGKVDCGGGELTSAGSYDIFVAKFGL
ncbi:MAG: hypothetical protein KAJ17_10415 [Candidatus Krumholzibacteria bacterium]|nr:hypothetical protein [Candidatus Krumholzibacteria bacterium]